MKTEWDVIVVGAGPGGSMTASLLAMEGVDVLLVDKEKFPRDKPCSDLYGPSIYELMDKVGVYDQMRENGFVFREVVITSPDYTELRGSNSKGLVCPRRVGDNLLKENAARLGAEVWEECWVNDLIIEDGQVRGIKAKYQGEFIEVRARIVIGCDGSHSWVAKRIGAFKDEPEMVYLCGRTYYEGGSPDLLDIEIHYDRAFTPGFVCLSPHPGYNNVVNVGMGIQMSGYYDAPVDGEAMVREFIKDSPFGERIRGSKPLAPWMGWRIGSAGQLEKIHDAGVMLCGDAGSFTEPFLLEGIAAAMKSGSLAAETAIEALKENDFSKESLARYEARVGENMLPMLKKLQGIATLAQNAEMFNQMIAQLKADPMAVAKLLH